MFNIVIVGTEGVGKTTLIKKLSIFLNEPFSIEYGKWYCENFINGYIKKNKILTTKKDFENIVIGQKLIFSKIKLESKKFFLQDTDFIYTKYFYSKQFNNINWLIKEIKMQKNDYYFFIKNKNIFFRLNLIINKKNFEKETKELLNLYKKFFNDNLIIFDGNNIEKIFEKIKKFLIEKKLIN